MKALVKVKAEPGLWMSDIPMPEVRSHDVLIKIKKTAICGTDIHIYQWDSWAQQHITIPLVIGHEFVGEIVDKGHEVTRFNIGDRVSAEGHIVCGYCRNCRAARQHLCRNNISIGVTRQGCFAEYLVMPETNIYPIPSLISDNIATIFDPLGNAVHTALSYNLAGEDVLITDAGPVGMMAAAVTRHVGARHIVITDINEHRLNLATKLHSPITINPNKTSLKEVMQQLDMREGFDIGLEMSGHSSALNDIINVMNHGGKIALLGFLPKETQIDWSQVIMKGLILKGIYGRKMFETWHKMVTMLESGLDVSSVITHEFAIDDYKEAFKMMSSGQSGVVIMEW